LLIDTCGNGGPSLKCWFFLLDSESEIELMVVVVALPVGLDCEEIGARTISDGVVVRILLLGGSVMWGSGSG
jgi:hypothetical protein